MHRLEARLGRRLRPVLLVAALVVASLIPLAQSTASAAGSCDDWAPNAVNVSLCKLGLIDPPSSSGGETPPKVDAEGCGDPVLKADGTPWTCTFSDNFNGPGLDATKWVPQQDGFKTGTAVDWACYVNDPSTIDVSGGELHLGLVKGANQPCPTLKNNPSTPYRAGSINSYHLFSQQYGRFEARIRNTASSVPGLQETFWLWPDDRAGAATSPMNGELDIAETYSQYPNLAIPFFHSPTDLLGAINGVNTQQTCQASRGVWNTYTLEWTSSKVTALINGVPCLSVNNNQSVWKKPKIIALTQLLGAGANAVTPNTPLPASMEVDYVRVWS